MKIEILAGGNIEKAFKELDVEFATKYSGDQYKVCEIDKKDIDVTFQCFVLDGPEVDKRALQVLAYSNEQNAVDNAYKTHDNKTFGTDILPTANIKDKDDAFSSLSAGKDRVIHLNSSETYDTDTGFNYVATSNNSDIAEYTGMKTS